jgi:hypothetical protein
LSLEIRAAPVRVLASSLMPTGKFAHMALLHHAGGPRRILDTWQLEQVDGDHSMVSGSGLFNELKEAPIETFLLDESLNRTSSLLWFGRPSPSFKRLDEQGYYP